MSALKAAEEGVDAPEGAELDATVHEPGGAELAGDACMVDAEAAEEGVDAPEGAKLDATVHEPDGAELAGEACMVDAEVGVEVAEELEESAVTEAAGDEPGLPADVLMAGEEAEEEEDEEALAAEVAAMEARVAALEAAAADAGSPADVGLAQEDTGLLLSAYDSDDEDGGTVDFVIGGSSGSTAVPAPEPAAAPAPASMANDAGMLSALGGYASDSDAEGGPPEEDAAFLSHAGECGAPPRSAAAERRDGGAVGADHRKEEPDDAYVQPKAELAPGCTVKLAGLKKAAHLNDRCGTLRRLDPNGGGRWVVELKAEPGKIEIKSLKAENLVFVKEAPQTAPEAQPDGFEPGRAVRLVGLQRAAQLNNLCGLLKQQVYGCPDRWQVELLMPGDRLEVKSISVKNLALDDAAKGEHKKEKDESKPEAEKDEKKEEADADADEPVGEGDDGDSDRTLPSDDDAADPACQGGLLVGMEARIENLQGAVHLNGQVATLEAFDSVTCRWQVKLPSGEVKALRPENLVSLQADADDDLIFEDADGSAEGDEYASLDANEIGAKAMQAELDGDDELAAKLNAVLAARLAKMIEDGTAAIEERIEVQREHVGRIIGKGGDRIKQIAEESGARLTFVREDLEDDEEEGLASTRILVVKGIKTAVEKARALVEETVAFASRGKGKGKGKGKDKGTRRGFTNHAPGQNPQGGASGAAGYDEGVCKWFAAGFCRNSAPTGCCRNGRHDAAAAVQAENTWVQSAPSAGSLAAASQPVLLLLDFEGGGNFEGRDGEDEIIEVPVLALCPETGRELGRFHRFSRPGFWDREYEGMRQRYPPQCFNPGSSAVPFPQVLADLRSWVCQLLSLPSEDQLTSDHFLFLTCGNWDVKKVMPRQCNNPVLGTVDFATQHLFCSRWSNLKEMFKEYYNLPDTAAPTGMRGMLNRLRIPLSGQHHLGMDDVSNLAKIAQTMILQGCRMHPTGVAKKLPTPGMSCGKGGCKGSGKGQKNGCSPKGYGKGCGKNIGKGYSKDFGKGCGKGFGKAGKGGQASLNGHSGLGGGFVAQASALGASGAQAAPRPRAPSTSAWAGMPSSRRPDPPAVGHSAATAAGAATHGTSEAARPKQQEATTTAGPDDEERMEDEELEASAAREDLQSFLSRAPVPGEEWEEEEEEENAEESATGAGVSLLQKRLRTGPASEAGLRAGVFATDGDGAAAAEADADEPPRKAPRSMADMLASLPKPKAAA